MVTLATVPSTRQEDERFAYVTSRGVDPRSARPLADEYDARGGSRPRTGVMKDAGPWTTWNVYVVRLYHLFMVVLYNLWILLNRLLQPMAFDPARTVRLEDFLTMLLEAARFRRRVASTA